MKIEDKWVDLKTLLPNDIVASIEQRVSRTLEFVADQDSQDMLAVRFIGARAADSASALKKLADKIIETSKLYTIQGSLSHSAAIEYPLGTDDKVVVSYLLFNQADLLKIDEELKLGSKSFFTAGETPIDDHWERE